MQWKVQLLGAPTITGPGPVRFTPERRAALALAYLALKGATPKLQLASLLWVHPEAETVRANLRQLLRRLRLAGGGTSLVEDAAQRLSLAPGVWVDVDAMRIAAKGRRNAEVLAAAGAGGVELLSGLSCDDAPELAEWLDGARDTVSGWVRVARQTETQRLEAAGEWDSALPLALAWMDEEPDSEDAARQLIRLHLLRGERTAALAAFERLRATLARELQASPSEETRRLLREVDRGPSAPAGARQVLPLSVQRPPRLAGRQAALEELERAWAEEVPMIFISGEPGVGKSRLAEEFADRHGIWLRAGGRIGELDVPYSAHTRMLRLLLAERPDVELTGWIRRELSRLLPELGDAPPPPMQQELELLRFYDANFEAMCLLHSHLDALVVDDIQYWDAASNRLFGYVLARASSTGRRVLPRFIDCYRRHELPDFTRQLVHALQAAGHARVIELEPLDAPAVRELLAATGVLQAAAQADRIARYTGGNPLFVVETLKHLIETSALEQGWPERLPPPGKVVMLIQRRLEQLSPGARELAQLAALAAPHFDVSLAAATLDLPERRLSELARELEIALVMVGERFTHDLVNEAVAATLAPADRRYLHARLAEHLQHRGAPPVLLARHWLEAGHPERALPFLLTAATAGEEAQLPHEAAELYARAALLLEGKGQHLEATRLREREDACRAAMRVRSAGRMG